jgi:hypothetical protein
MWPMAGSNSRAKEWPQGTSHAAAIFGEFASAYSFRPGPTIVEARNGGRGRDTLWAPGTAGPVAPAPTGLTGSRGVWTRLTFTPTSLGLLNQALRFFRGRLASRKA